MNLKTSSALLLMILLASCTSPDLTPLASEAPSATSAPSETPTPKPTNTPTLSPTPEFAPPPVMTWEGFGRITETNYADFFTPMTQAEFDEFREWMLMPENTLYNGSAEPVTVHMSDSSVSGYRMQITGELDKDIFSPYLLNVDGQFFLVIRVVVNTSSGNQILPVVISEYNRPDDVAYRGKAIAYDFNVLANYIKGFVVGFKFFIDKEDGLTSIESNFINGIIDAQTSLEPLPSVGIDQ